jgi:two-component system, LytTR family, response regulator
MARCIIIDDEKHARYALQEWIRMFLGKRLEVACMASSVAEGVAAIKKHDPDIVFLDIEMPGQNGFTLFDHFEEVSFHVVFCTAYAEYAINAIRVAAFDYMLKPVNPEDLTAMMDRFEKSGLSAEDNNTKTKTLINNYHAESDVFNSIALPTRNGYRLEKISGIIYCKAQEAYCEIHARGRSSYLVSRRLKQMEEILPESLFFRIHKSFLVNLNYIETYKKSEGYIILQSGEKLEVATRRGDEFLQRLTRRA